MSDQPITDAPRVRFTDEVHAMTTGMACEASARNLEILAKNLSRLVLPYALAARFEQLNAQILEGRQMIVELGDELAAAAKAQKEEGTL
jgi:hypothetical protein